MVMICVPVKVSITGFTSLRAKWVMVQNRNKIVKLLATALMILTALAAVAGLMVTARTGAAVPSMAGQLGQDWLLPAFLAPVLGGTLLIGAIFIGLNLLSDLLYTLLDPRVRRRVGQR